MKGRSLRSWLLLSSLLACARLPGADSAATISAAKSCDQVVVSPDGKWLAATRTYSLPSHGRIWDDADASSRLVIWSYLDGELGDHFVEWEDSSVRIVTIGWSPDSRFLVIVCTAANGHQPWSFPTLVFDTNDSTLHGTSPLGVLAGKDVRFTAPNTLHLSTINGGAPQPVDFELEKHIGDLPVVARLQASDAP